MKKTFNEKSKQEKTILIIRWIMQIALVFVAAYIVVLRIKTGQHIPMPLIGCILLVIVGLFRIGAARERHQGSAEDQKKFSKIVIKSAILAPIIVAIFITIVVLIKLKT